MVELPVGVEIIKHQPVPREMWLKMICRFVRTFSKGCVIGDREVIILQNCYHYILQVTIMTFGNS